MSQESRARSFVKFVNRTRVPVDIMWRGFNGEYVRYASRLNPNAHYCVNTFATHLWQVWNSATLEMMNVGGGPVFYPQQWNGQQQRTVIYIDEPVHTLVRLCLEKIKSLVNLDDSDKLDIPQPLIDELKKRRTVEVQEYLPRRPQNNDV